VATIDRFNRQEDLVPRQDLCLAGGIGVIGVGAVGRQVALQLAAIGAPAVSLFDFDVVEESNITTQGYLRGDLGRPKCEATRDAMLAIEPHGLTVVVHNDHWRRKLMASERIWFCCVDSIETRSVIWQNLRTCCSLFIDGRMLGETIRVLTAADPPTDEYYAKTLFAREEAVPGRCTAHSTIYTANLTAALMVAGLSRWLRQIPPVPDLLLSLPTMDLAFPAEITKSAA
jgi:sulfur carrier protein ThiS adenylyltransferase